MKIYDLLPDTYGGVRPMRAGIIEEHFSLSLAKSDRVEIARGANGVIYRYAVRDEEKAKAFLARLDETK